jgi:hypothetical protein
VCVYVCVRIHAHTSITQTLPLDHTKSKSGALACRKYYTVMRFFPARVVLVESLYRHTLVAEHVCTQKKKETTPVMKFVMF